MQNNRIQILDSFRGIAILLVIFFHYFSRWTSLYPYQNTYDFFGYGKFGVQFFFMISGFVILFTLEKTKSLAQFWFNRFIRLLPAMFFASIITYLFFTLFDNEMLFPTSHYFKNVLVSLTFIQPGLLSSLTRYTIQLDYISGSYWSLWVEIQFYVLASFFYFFYQKKFHTYFYIMAALVVISSFLLSHIYSNNFIILKIKALKSIFNLVDGLPFFCLGAVVYELLSNNENIKLVTPVSYPAFVWLMQQSFLIVTDSGGIQEEAPSLGKPVIVTRTVSERPEGVAAGFSTLVGSDTGKIVNNIQSLLDNFTVFKNHKNPYGNGNASKQIVNYLLKQQ